MEKKSAVRLNCAEMMLALPVSASIRVQALPGSAKACTGGAVLLLPVNGHHLHYVMKAFVCSLSA